jgi:putative RecB family exonuclease
MGRVNAVGEVCSAPLKGKNAGSCGFLSNTWPKNAGSCGFLENEEQKTKQTSFLRRRESMEISELRKNPHLSASSISTYLDCGLLYKLGRVLKLQPEIRSDALEFGSIIHKVLAEFYRHKLEGEIVPLLDLQILFEAWWKKATGNGSEITYKDGKDAKTLLQEGKDLLATYYKKLPRDSFQVIAIEESFQFKLPNLPVPIIGVLDLVEEDESGALIITDWKTSSHAYSADEVDKNLQITIYQMAARANGYRDREILMRFHCLIKTRVPKFEEYYTTRSEMDEMRTMKKIRHVFEGISKSVFIPNESWKCKGCSYKNACDDWFEKEEEEGL